MGTEHSTWITNVPMDGAMPEMKKWKMEIRKPNADNMGCATLHQGGIIQLENGDWWGFSMLDFLAVGRTTCLSPVTWVDGWPYFGLENNLGRSPRTWFKPDVSTKVTPHAPYVRSDNFDSGKLLPVWQWNHLPDDSKWAIKKGNSSGASREDSKSAGIKEEKQPGTQEQASVEQPASDKTESQTQKQATMAKSYPFIQSAAKVNSLVVEENGGFYMVETMADNVEEFVMKAKQTESTLAAKLTEVEQLNATIEQMKKDHAEALANLKAEHEKEVSSLKDAHKKESEHMTAKLNEAQKSIEQKDAEIKELSETAQLEPTPQDPPKDNNGGQESGQFHVQSVCGENMSWGEKAEARRKRDAEISKAR
jgi:hypothetical protein